MSVLDTYPNNVVLYLKGDDLNGTTSPFDSSLVNPKSFTARGGAKTTTTTKLVGSGSLDLSLSGASFIADAQSSDFFFGTGDFYIGAWTYRTVQTEVSEIASLHRYGVDSLWIFHVLDGKLRFFNGDSNAYTIEDVIPLDSFVHLAVSRRDGVLRLFVDGKVKLEAEDTYDYTGYSYPLTVGRDYTEASVSEFVGYIDELVIVKGVAVYTSDFTPEGAPIDPPPEPDDDFIKWVKDSSACKCVLVDVNVKTGGVETTRRLSTKAYTTSPTDNPSNMPYMPIISGGVRFTESVSIDGSVSISFGDIELANHSGEIDSWLDDFWSNRPVKVFYGDVSWPRAQFKKIFDGVVVGIDSRRRDRVNLRLSDKLQRLNSPVSDVKLGGSTPNADRLIPLCFGEVHNVEPLLVDPVLHEYQVHNGPIESFIEVRDNGVPVEYTPFPLSGKFRLNKQPAGTITCSVQGDKPAEYANDVASLVKRLVTGFGSESQKLDLSDIDTTDFDVFKAENTQPVGIYIKDRANVLDVCNQIAASVGARLALSKGGLLRLVKISLPRLDAGSTATSSDMVERSLEISQMPPVVAGVQVGYCKNYTVQTDLQTGIPAQHRDLFGQEWSTVTRTNTLAAANYNLFTEPKMQETLLLTDVDAIAEANRRLDLFSTQRKVFKYRGYAKLMLEELGDSHTIVHSRFGLASGKTGQIISLATDWINNRVDIEVLI